MKLLYYFFYIKGVTNEKTDKIEYFSKKNLLFCLTM